jgi:nucleoside-diphosphate-sugar epimerase
MNFSILLTGASGFVGGHLAEALVRQKQKVKLLVRSSIRLAFPTTPLMQLCEVDVTDPESLQKAMVGIETVYHLAGILRGPNFANYEWVNAQGTRNVCEALVRGKKGKKLVYVSSLSAAGPSEVNKPLTEEMPAQPVSFYGQTKLMGEEIVRSYRKKLKTVILRPAAVYGPREKDLLEYFKMVKQGWVFIPGDGAQKVSFVHVFDLVEAILLAGKSPKASGETFFVSDGKSYTFEEFSRVIAGAQGKSFHTLHIPIPLVKAVAMLADMVGRITGKPGILSSDKIKEAVVPGWVCSNQRLVRKLGFKPQYDIEKGVRNSVEFYLKAGWI